MMPDGLPLRMSDRSDELTENREPRSTDDLLEETENLLSEPGAGIDDAPASPAGGEREQPPPDSAAADSSVASDSRSSRLPSLPSLPSGPSIGRYFSPKAFLAVVLLVGAGLFAGAVALPIGGAGRIVGMFAVAFAIGLVASKRRYLEMSAAGVSVGAATALLMSPFITIANGQAVLAVGASAGLAAVVGGYYFGRDLRDGLFRDVE